jgi:hypothetical protein
MTKLATSLQEHAPNRQMACLGSSIGIEDLMYSSVPLGHKLVAVIVAVATSCGIYAFLRYGEAQVAFAAWLSFDSTVAQRLDPGISRVPRPAIVLGQSILSDSVVTRIVPQADASSFSTAQAIGEFRTRLELSQPTAGLLLVRYHDPDPGQAAATANAVAKALAEWAPSTTSAPPPSANAQPVLEPVTVPAPGPTPAPASAATPQHAPAAEPSLAFALGELQARLSAADQRVGPESSFRSEHDRQRYLESQVRAAQQKLDDLRSRFAHSGSASGAQARLDVIQHALALFWPSAAGFNTAGTSEVQLDFERNQLTRDVGVFEQQQQAVRRVEAANSASVNPPSQQTAPLGSQQQSAPEADVSSPPASGATRNPLHLEHMAGLPAPVAWWPSVLIGCFCGLLYWGLAFARYRSSRESDDQLDVPEKSSISGSRLLDTDAPVRAGSPSKWIETYPVETSSRRRACFTFDPDSISASAPDQPPSPESVQRSTEDTVPDDPPKTAVVSTETGLDKTASDADALAPLRAPEEQDELCPEKIVDLADSWEEKILKNLSQTSVARMLDPQLIPDVAAAKGPARDVAPPPSESDRLAG